MEQKETHESRMSESRDLAVAEYRPVCALAIVSLVLGILSFLSIATAFGWVAALLGLATSFVSLRRISKSEPLMIGRGLAVAGLLLSIFFGCVGAGQWVTMNRLLTRQALAYGADWFEALKHDQPQVAHQMSMAPALRQAPGGDVWRFYNGDMRFEKQLRDFVASPVIRAVLALGDKAEIRYCGIRGYASRLETMEVQPIYAITYPSDGGKKTFFAAVTIQRDRVGDTGKFTWRVASFNFTKRRELNTLPE